MITYQCDCDSKYDCESCPLKSRDVFLDFARRLGHFYAWNEVKITLKRDFDDVVYVDKNDDVVKDE